jgi:hypothetical protein
MLGLSFVEFAYFTVRGSSSRFRSDAEHLIDRFDAISDISLT